MIFTQYIHHLISVISVPGPPRSIKVVVDSQDAVVVSWLAPDQANGVIVQFNIYVR